jgi:hypothetical protein
MSCGHHGDLDLEGGGGGAQVAAGEREVIGLINR